MRLSWFIAGAALSVLGCAHHEAEVLDVPMTTGATLVPNESAIRILTAARCGYEEACGHVGDGKRFATPAECSKAADLDERTAIGLDACPFGVDGDRLDRCAAAVRAQPCNSVIVTVDHIAECRRSDLCW